MKIKMIKLTKVILFLLGVIYMIICIYMFRQQKQLLYFPQIENRNFTRQFSEQEVNFVNDDVRLHGWMQLSSVDINNPLVIYYGGNGSEVSYNQQWFKNIGIRNFLLLNYRGYGRSEGEPDESKLKSDALFIFDKVTKENAIDPDSVILMGRSLGSGVATYVASQRKVKKVVLITPYDSLVKVAGSHYPALPVSLLMNQRFESDVLASSIDVPVLCLIAEEDKIIPPVHAHNVCEAWKGEKSISLIKNVGHTNIIKHPEFYRSIKMFVQ